MVHPAGATGALGQGQTVTGLIDLGDMCAAPRVCDLAIAGERPLTLYLDKREIVTLMTLGSHPEALAIAIAEDRVMGRIPACIVACFGATGLGSIDPLHEIGVIAQSEDIHLHVDAAWAGKANASF